MAKDNKLNDEQIKELLTNISDMLKFYTVTELNLFLAAGINKKQHNYSAQEYILNLVCDTYSVTRHSLLHAKNNQQITGVREVAFCLLHYMLGISQRKIAMNIFTLKNHSPVFLAVKKYKSLDMKIKQDREFKASIDILQEKVQQEINQVKK
jgi:chromosomal replication initiation ATPase DnaA